MKKAVLFDLDGTLLDTIADINAALNRTLGSSITFSQCKAFVGRGLRNALKDALSFLGREIPSDEAEFEKLYSVFENNYREYPVVYTKPYEGIVELLDTLKEKGFTLGVFSAKEQELAEYVIEHTLASYFSFIAGLHGAFPGKPHTDAPQAFMKKAGCTVDELVYVGDGETDWKTGCNTGCKTVMVTWGFRSRESLISSSVDPSVMVNNCSELLSALLSD